MYLLILIHATFIVGISPRRNFAAPNGTNLTVKTDPTHLFGLVGGAEAVPLAVAQAIWQPLAVIVTGELPGAQT